MTQFDGKPVRIIDRNTNLILCVDEAPSGYAFDCWRKRTGIDAFDFDATEYSDRIDVYVTVRP